jgi:hypothetical protein
VQHDREQTGLGRSGSRSDGGAPREAFGTEEVDLVVGRKKTGVPNMPDRRVRAAVEGLHVRTLGTDHRVEFQVAGNNVGISRIRTVLWLEDR